MPPPTAEELSRGVLRVADTVGTLMEFWGFKRPMGRLWALLYLAPEPLGAADIGAQLSMSAGAVSMTLAELSKWGVVRRAWKPGKRRDFFEAETNIWKMVSRVLRDREQQLVRDSAEAFKEAEAVMARAVKAAPRAEAARLEFARKRIAMLAGLARLGETLLSGIITSGRIDTRALRQFPGDGDADE